MLIERLDKAAHWRKADFPRRTGGCSRNQKNNHGKPGIPIGSAAIAVSKTRKEPDVTM